MKSLATRLPCLLLLASGCSSTSDAPDAATGPSPDAGQAAWSETSTKIRALAKSARMAPFSVRVYDAQGRLAFVENVGGFDESKAVPVASAAKWTTAATIMSLVEKGKLSLQSTTGNVLGWSGDKGKIRLEELLSLRAGLAVREGETLAGLGNPTVTLQDGVTEIASKTELVTPPGTRFQYGSVPLQVAAAMAEKVSGDDWNALFEASIARPLGMKSTRYYAGSPRNTGAANPAVAGAMVSTTADYLAFLRMVFAKGAIGNTRVLAEETVDAMEADGFPRTRLPPAESPLRKFFSSFHYAAGHWIECRGVQAGGGTPTTCDPQSPRSSLGAAGWYPWFDRATGYYALLSTFQTADSDLRVAQLTKAIFEVKAEVAKGAEAAFRPSK